MRVTSANPTQMLRTPAARVRSAQQGMLLLDPSVYLSEFHFQKSCSSRKRRSDEGEEVLERNQRSALVDPSGKINQNLLKNLRTGSINVRTSGGNSNRDPWAKNAGEDEDEGRQAIMNIFAAYCLCCGFSIASIRIRSIRRRTVSSVQ
jgi:hypothetical protein